MATTDGIGSRPGGAAPRARRLRGIALLAALGGASASCVPPPVLPGSVAYAPQPYAPQLAAQPSSIAGGPGSEDLPGGVPDGAQVVVTPGEAPALAASVAVTRLVFPEGVLFDFDSDAPRPEAGAAFDRLADAIRRDAPGTEVTVLGHTDAVGTDAYNYALSARRARGVFQALVARGVDPGQLSTVAVGKDQPAASNATAEGRARNRRVEFLISPSLDANLAVVRRQAAVPARGRRSVHLAVFRPGEHGEALRQAGEVEIAAAGAAPAPARPSPGMAPRLAQPAPPHQVELNTPRAVERAPLGPAVSY